jgi:hypothetical protein
MHNSEKRLRRHFSALWQLGRVPEWARAGTRSDRLSQRDYFALRAETTDQASVPGLDSTGMLIGGAGFDRSDSGPGAVDAQAAGTGRINPNHPVRTSSLDDRGAAGADHLHGHPKPVSALAGPNPLTVGRDLGPAPDKATKLLTGCTQTGLSRPASESCKFDRPTAAFEAGVSRGGHLSRAACHENTRGGGQDKTGTEHSDNPIQEVPSPVGGRTRIVPNFFVVDLRQIAFCRSVATMMVNPA